MNAFDYELSRKFMMEKNCFAFTTSTFWERITLTVFVVTQNVMVEVLKKNLLKFRCQYLRRSDVEK